MAKQATTMRVQLSCSCLPARRQYRYARSLDGLVQATRAWMDRGGHGNPNHTPTIQAEAQGFVRSTKHEAALLRALGR